MTHLPKEAYESLMDATVVETGKIDEGKSNSKRNLANNDASDHKSDAMYHKIGDQLTTCSLSTSINCVKKGTAAGAEPGWELVPPDGGWGWLVLFGSMLVNVLVPGTVKSFGVLFVEFLEVFEAKPAAAAWIPALCYFLYSSLGPLSSILSVKYSYRTVTLLGGTFAAAGMIMTFWAGSVSFLYVSYGLLVGTGAGLSFPPTVYIVTSYFVRLRGLANGLCISGSAIGSIILPPVLRYLLETYGYRGAVLIMGGITLNVWVAAMFYHPVEQHMKRVPGGRDRHAAISRIPEEDGALSPDDGAVSVAAMHAVTRSQVRSTPALHSAPRPRPPPPPNRSLDMYSQQRLGGTRHRELASTARQPRRSPSTSSFQYVSTPYHGSTLSALHPHEFASSLTLRSLSLNPVSACCGAEGGAGRARPQAAPPARNKYFDVTLFRDPLYLVILISNSTNAISYTNFIILLPSYAITLGFDKSLAAWLISIVSALDLVGRIGGSALSDTELVPKYWYFIGGLLMSGAALAVLPLAGTYATISAFCGVFGLASGVYVGVTAVIMADMLGTERLTSSYGISLFVNGILQLVGPPICGLWFEQTGTYSSLFTSLGLVLVLGAAIWGFVPFIKRADPKAHDHSYT